MKTPEEKTVSISSPEGLIMLSLAIIFDIWGLLTFILDFVFGIGLFLSFIPDFFGLLLFGGWMLFRTGHVTISKRAGKTFQKSGRKIFKRLGLAFIGETLPFFGDLAFCWTLAVYFELKNN